MKFSARKIRPHAKTLVWLLTLVYFASYITRINFAVMLVRICTDLNAEKTALAVVLTGLTVTYGMGQILSGIIGDKISPALLLTVGLSVASLCNLLLPLCPSIPAMTAVWCVNGMAHSLLWPPIVRILSVHLTDEEYGFGAVRVSWGSSFATVVLYLLCPILLRVLSWQKIFLLCAAVGIAICILWTVLSKKLLSYTPLQSPTGTAVSQSVSTSSPKAPTIPLPKTVTLPLALIMMGILLQGALRDGVTNWMPSYLSEAFSIAPESAIIIAVIPAIFSVLSFSFFDYLHRRFLRNEVFCAAMIFACALSASLLLLLCNRLSLPTLASALLLALLVAFMHGINLMLITIVPKRLVKSGKVSTYSGLLNAFTYVGASLSGYGFAYFAERFGWGFTILSWAVLSLAGFVVCLIATPLWAAFRRTYEQDLPQ